MPTQNQTEANRKNAQHSTGPTTPEGKAKSSMNALKTGIDAKSELIRGEDPEAHATLVAEYYDRFQPATPEERCLLDRMIASEWLHRRYCALEGAVWELGFGELSKPRLAVAYVHRSGELTRIDRRLNSAQRNFDKAHKELRAIQEKRLSDAPPTEAPHETATETKPLTPELGSFLISINEPIGKPSTIEVSPYTPLKTEPNSQNEDPDVPLAA